MVVVVVVVVVVMVVVVVPPHLGALLPLPRRRPMTLAEAPVSPSRPMAVCGAAPASSHWALERPAPVTPVASRALAPFLLSSLPREAPRAVTVCPAYGAHCGSKKEM